MYLNPDWFTTNVYFNGERLTHDACPYGLRVVDDDLISIVDHGFSEHWTLRMDHLWSTLLALNMMRANESWERRRRVQYVVHV